MATTHTRTPTQMLQQQQLHMLNGNENSNNSSKNQPISGSKFEPLEASTTHHPDNDSISTLMLDHDGCVPCIRHLPALAQFGPGLALLVAGIVVLVLTLRHEFSQSLGVVVSTCAIAVGFTWIVYASAIDICTVSVDRRARKIVWRQRYALFGLCCLNFWGLCDNVSEVEFSNVRAVCVTGVDDEFGSEALAAVDDRSVVDDDNESATCYCCNMDKKNKFKTDEERDEEDPVTTTVLQTKILLCFKKPIADPEGCCFTGGGSGRTKKAKKDDEKQQWTFTLETVPRDIKLLKRDRANNEVLRRVREYEDFFVNRGVPLQRCQPARTNFELKKESSIDVATTTTSIRQTAGIEAIELSVFYLIYFGVIGYMAYMAYATRSDNSNSGQNSRDASTRRMWILVGMLFGILFIFALGMWLITRQITIRVDKRRRVLLYEKSMYGCAGFGCGEKVENISFDDIASISVDVEDEADCVGKCVKALRLYFVSQQAPLLLANFDHNKRSMEDVRGWFFYLRDFVGIANLRCEAMQRELLYNSNAPDRQPEQQEVQEVQVQQEFPLAVPQFGDAEPAATHVIPVAAAAAAATTPEGM